MMTILCVSDKVAALFPGFSGSAMPSKESGSRLDRRIPQIGSVVVLGDRFHLVNDIQPHLQGGDKAMNKDHWDPRRVVWLQKVEPGLAGKVADEERPPARAIHSESAPELQRILSPAQYEKLQAIREEKIKEAIAKKRAGR
jgi:hypothetical protein